MKKFLLACIMFLPFLAFSQSVFINEIHYDNDGGDVNEGVEIAGPAGTDLTGWTLVGYNGSGGAVYATVNLSGSIPDQSNGYGTLWFAVSGLQNGAPDGIALADGSGTLVQFLSYEGSFSGVGGPADGVVSVDIGIAQAGSTPLDNTLQLSGQGSVYTDFTWEGPVTQTRGAVNLNQSFGQDTDPPVWTTGFPKLMNVLDTQGDLHLSLDEPGTVYFVVLADGADAPTSEQVKAGVDYGTVTVFVSGNVDVAEAATEYIETIKGATPETAYDIYVVAEDKAGTPNLQATPVLLETTTTAARSITILAPQANDTYYIGTEVTFQWTSANVAQVMIGGYDFDGGEYFFLEDMDSGEPYVIDASLGEFKYTIPNYASTELIDIRIYDAADTTFYAKVYPVNLIDELDPSLMLTVPEPDAVDVELDTWLWAAFDEEIYAGTGNVVIKNADNTIFESFEINAAITAGTIVIDDNVMIIKPTSPFAQAKKYFVEMDAGVVVDFKDNPFAGITGIATWSFTTTTIPIPIFFDDFNDGDLAPWTVFDEAGDAETWEPSSGAARINGYLSAQDHVDWLISPSIDLTGYVDVFVLFDAWYRYGVIDANNYLKFYYSVDYDGNTANIGTATWTEIAFTPPSSDNSWEEVGPVEIPDLNAPVYFAFKYVEEAAGGTYMEWRIDNFAVAGYAPLGSDATLSDLQAGGTTVDEFSAAKTEYTMILPAGTSQVPVVTFTKTDPEASAYVTDATDLTGDAAARTTTVTVTSANGSLTKVYSIQFDPILEVADLAALRAVTDYDRVYQVSGEVILTAQMSFNNQKYLQDATAGIQIFDADAVITTTYAEGDGITGLTGTLLDYFGQLEMIPYEDPGAASSTGNTVNPQTITVSEFNTNFENYESELVEIEGVSFADANGTATFANGQDYDFTAGANTAVLRIHFYNTTVTGAVIPTVADIRGIAIWHSDEAKISPRYIEDITDVSSVKELPGEELRIYPSPVTEILYLENIRNANLLEVMDITGSRVLTRALDGQSNYELNVSDLPRGIYFLRLTSEAETLTRKFIKK